MDAGFIYARVGRSDSTLATTMVLDARNRSASAREGVAEAITGAVYTTTNATTANELVMFVRDALGGLRKADAVATGGRGVGGGLDPLVSQNAVVVAGGERPTSIAVRGHLVYVLNAGAQTSFAGFAFTEEGRLRPLAGASRALPGVLSAQIGIDPLGEFLVVTDRARQVLIVYPLEDRGLPVGPGVLTPSNGAGPFSFAFAGPRTLLVAEVAANAVSSYALEDDGRLRLITGSVANGQAATCWIVTDGRRAFTANPGASSISAFGVQPGRGEVTLIAGGARFGTRPLDLALSRNGRFLYALDPAIGGVDAFEAKRDGTLVKLDAALAGLPLYAQGLAAM